MDRWIFFYTPRNEFTFVPLLYQSLLMISRVKCGPYEHDSGFKVQAARTLLPTMTELCGGLSSWLLGHSSDIPCVLERCQDQQPKNKWLNSKPSWETEIPFKKTVKEKESRHPKTKHAVVYTGKQFVFYHFWGKNEIDLYHDHILSYGFTHFTYRR